MEYNFKHAEYDVDLTNYNTYRIHSKCKVMVSPENEDELKDILNVINENKLSYFILGNGSNIIVPDEYFNGVIINLKKMNKMVINDTVLIADAGAMLPVIASTAIQNNLKGLEWAIGIPGTLGASIMGNAGAYLSSIMDYIVSVKVMDFNGNITYLNKDEISYEYRNTSLKDTRNYIVLSASLKLMNGNKEESLKLAEDRRERRLASQPLEYPSAGSVFRNPSKDMPAGKLIEECGLKGKIVGGAQVSLKHANFIVNKDNNATSKDIKKLINLIKEKVKETDNIDLICEQEIVEWK